MTTIVSIAQGGTGSNNAAAARTSLGAAPSAAYDVANNAYAAANTASSTGGGGYAQANAAYAQANAAYNNSNTRLSTSGGSISGDLAITGNLTVQGNATTINVSNLSVNDSIILLSTNAVGDSNDIGFIGHFDRGPTATHAGLIRKATQNQFYLFDNYEVEPTNNVIDVSGNNFRVGNLRLGIINANSYVTSAGMDVTGQANAAYSQANVAYGQANAAYGQANAAYGAANNRVLKAGDTMTGQLNISSGGLIVTGGDVGIGTTSPSAKLHVQGGNLTFGKPGSGTNVNGRWFSIEGNADSDGEGSSRIFFTEHNATTSEMSNYGMSLGYRGGSTSIVGSDGNTWTGLSSIDNGEWGMWGHNNSAAGSLIMRGSRSASYVSFPNANVGIGTATAAYTLDLLSSTAGYVTRFKSSGNYGGVLADAGSSGSAGGGYFAVAKNGSRSGLIGVTGAWLGDSTTDLAISSESGKDIKFYTNGSSTLSVAINTSGNVGIGTSNAQVPLHVNRSGSSGSQTIVLGLSSVSLRPIIQFSEGTDVNSGTGMAIEYDGRGSGGTNALRFNSVDNVPVHTFMSNGWVGFGNTSPTAPLFVQHTNLTEPYSGIYIKNTDTTGAAYTGVTADGVLQSHYRFALNGSTKWQWRCGAGSGIDDLRLYSFTLVDDVMTVNNAGKINFKYQPAFHAYGGQGVPNNYVTYPSVYVNRGSHYSTSTGRFTAPVAGLYFFFWDAIGSNSNDVHRWYLRKNGATVGSGDFHLRQDTGATGSEYADNGSRVAILDLAASDYVQIYYNADGGTTSYAGGDYVTFGGYLLG